MVINTVEAELILLHIDDQATFGYAAEDLLRCIITQEDVDYPFTPDELWWIIRNVPVEGEASLVYHELKVKAAKALLEEYHAKPAKTPAERAIDMAEIDKFTEEIYAREEGSTTEDETSDETCDDSTEAGGTEPRRVLSGAENEDSEGDRPTDSLNCACTEHPECHENSKCQEE